MADELTPKQAMDQAVHSARMRLNDGALVQETLEYLWRTAYAAGVRTGQRPVAERNLSERAMKVELATMDGWQYGTPWVFFPDLKEGGRFVYGGVDRQAPICARNVVVIRVGWKSKMQFDDTAERCGIPALCWVRAIPAPVAEEGTCG